MLQDKTAILRLEIDTVKYHNQEMEKIFWEHCNCKKKKERNQASKQARKKEKKNGHLQKTIKLNEETLTKIFQYNG